MNTRSCTYEARKKIYLLFLFLILFLLIGCGSHVKTVKMEQPIPALQAAVIKAPPPGTIWPGERATNMLFADRKARSVNDIVTIVIDEFASGQNSANTKLSRDSKMSAGIDGFYQLSPDKTFVSQYKLGGSHSNSHKGAGNTNRDGKLEARITAKVIKVLENGNLIIEGRRQLTVNEEDQYIIISGIVRPDDISSENFISSQYIADARIVYTGKGVINDKMRPGWATRIADWVWPF